MEYGVFGGFEIQRKPNRHGRYNKEFWARVAEVDARLPYACGCYVFGLQNGRNIKTWYVGMTEKRTFERECFTQSKQNYYNEVLVDHRGTALLFLLPRLTPTGRFSRPTSGRYRDVSFLETLLMGMALEQNKELVNMRGTKFLRDMTVPGVVNSSPGRNTQSVSDLRNALGLHKPGSH